MNNPNEPTIEFTLTFQNNQLALNDELKPNDYSDDDMISLLPIEELDSDVVNDFTDDDMISLMSFEESDSDVEVIPVADSAGSSTEDEIANEVLTIFLNK